jgi:hypothetical protein
VRDAAPAADPDTTVVPRGALLEPVLAGLPALAAFAVSVVSATLAALPVLPVLPGLAVLADLVVLAFLAAVADSAFTSPRTAAVFILTAFSPQISSSR